MAAPSARLSTADRHLQPRPQQVARARPTAARLAGDAGACAAENPRPTLLRADSDPRRPAYSAHTAQATDGGHQRRHPELRAEGRCDDAAGREEKDLPQLKSTIQTKPVSLIPTPCSYIEVRTSL